jgi:hypothetical protein
MIPQIPRNASVLREHGLVSRDWDKWFQTVEARLNALSAVTLQGAFADPNGDVVASPGALYTYSGGGAGVTLWVKESGVDTDTGWVAK